MGILSNIENYKDMAELCEQKQINADEFHEMMERGFIRDITMGTFNGATNTFQARELTPSNIFEAIVLEIQECEGHAEMLSDYTEINRAIVREFTEVYDVFTVGKNIYVDID